MYTESSIVPRTHLTLHVLEKTVRMTMRQFWRCRCGAVLLSPGRPTGCPRGEGADDPATHPLDLLSAPRPFDFLVIPGACRKCGGAMVATGDDVVDALPRVRCAVCGWTWFVRPADVAEVRPLARTKKTKGV